MGEKGSNKVIKLLNEVLAAELTAINQYFLHSEMCADWGYEYLHKKIRKDSIDEMKHAELLIERILYLNCIPNVQKMGPIKIGKSVPEQFQSDLALEHEAVERLNKGIDACRAEGDNGTRMLLEGILDSEEEHVEWLTTQLGLIAQLGEKPYLVQQIKGAE